MKNINYLIICTLALLCACQKSDMTKSSPAPSTWLAVETAANGNQLSAVTFGDTIKNAVEINVLPDSTFQTITGFGGAFTESSAYLLNQLSAANRNKILEAYFGDEGARYSLTRTHIASCDFSLSNYTYAPKAGDTELEHFTIQQDTADLIPMIKDAMAVSTDGFKIIASPWTAPPWMKDNKKYVGGKLLPQYQDAFALYFSKYLKAYQDIGIDIWGLTVVNEPHGNGNNWESMHMTPKEMTDFVVNHLGPTLENEGWKDVKILGYDQNRAELDKWVDEMYRDSVASRYFDGTAIHWYESTYDYFPEELDYAHHKAPDKYMIQTEACVDAEVPHWKDDAWYWSKEATDWGWDWAAEDKKYLHPKYVPTFRYARDIIGCLNHHVDGWVDWNMVLDRKGGPNWFENWCVAPIIVDPDADEVYLTPIYYVMSHFSKYIRPGAKRIGITHNDDELMVTAAQNPDGSIAIIVFNPTEEAKNIKINLNGDTQKLTISKKAIQTILKSTKDE